MPRTLSCARGHVWEEAALFSPGQTAVCPVCGGAGSGPEQSSLEGEEAQESTVLQVATPHVGTRASPDQSRPELPDYEILGELGRGGMGIVYKVRQLSMDRIVAIKVIRKDRLQHEEAVRRFRREAQAASRLHHPNIVRVFGSDHTGKTHYLVMEFVDGLTLERLVEQKGPLSFARACDFIRQAALGLQHAHDMALVHRDIKPSNLMVTPPPDSPRAGTRGFGYRVKVLDMGVARLLELSGQGPGESLSTITQGGAVIGTADYVAPEQLENPHGADIRADLYSLGCTFYFLLTGQVPFPGGTLLSKLDKQRWETATSIHQLRDDVPPALVAIVQKLMAKRPEERYQTPAEVARALEELARSGYKGSGAGAVPLTEARRLSAHTDVVWSAMFSPDGKQILSGGRDRQMLLWEAVTGSVVRTFPKMTQDVRVVAFSPEGDRIVSGSGIMLRLWDVSTGQELRRFAGHSGAVKCAAFFADGRRLVSAGDDKTIRVWDLASGRELQRLARHTGAVTCLKLLPGDDHVVSGSRDQTLRVWDLRSGQETQVLSGGGGAVLGLDVSGDGQIALSAHFDTVLRLWDLGTGQEIRRFVGHKQMVSAVALTPDLKRFVSGGQDQTVRLWDVENGCETACVIGHQGGVHAVAVAPDGKAALSCGADGTIGIWELPEV